MCLFQAIDDASSQFSAEQKTRLRPLHNAMMNLKKSLKTLGGSSLSNYQQSNRQAVSDGQPVGSPAAAQSVNESRERLTVEIDKASGQLVDQLPNTFELKASLEKAAQDTAALATLFAKSYLEVVNKMASGGYRLRKTLAKLTSLNESEAKTLDESSLTQVMANNLNCVFLSGGEITELSDALEQFIELE